MMMKKMMMVMMMMVIVIKRMMMKMKMMKMTLLVEGSNPIPTHGNACTKAPEHKQTTEKYEKHHEQKAFLLLPDFTPIAP